LHLTALLHFWIGFEHILEAFEQSHCWHSKKSATHLMLSLSAKFEWRFVFDQKLSVSLLFIHVSGLLTDRV